MELLTLSLTAKLLGRTTQTVRNMVKCGELEAVYPKTGKNGRPNMMITVSSYGAYLLKSGEERQTMSTGKTDDYKGFTADELTRISRNSLFRKLDKYHSGEEERAQRRIKNEALGYSQIVKYFLDAEQKVEKLKDEPRRLEDKKRAALNSEYDEAVKRGLIKLHDGCKELWVSKKFVEWMNSDEEYLRIKEELSDAGSDYNRYLALKVNWETENEDIIKAERVRSKKAELLQADPETLRNLGITPDPTFEEAKTTPQSEMDENRENVRAALKSIHPTATDAEIEGMLKSV